jgi:hypothetical protein
MLYVLHALLTTVLTLAHHLCLPCDSPIYPGT